MNMAFAVKYDPAWQDRGKPRPMRLSDYYNFASLILFPNSRGPQRCLLTVRSRRFGIDYPSPRGVPVASKIRFSDQRRGR